MGGLALFARQVGRRQDGLNSLAFAAAVMALIDPYVLWDVGFQLSFAATLGLVLYGGPSQAAVASVAGRVLPPASAQRLASLVGEYFLFTLAAQLTTLPVVVYHFGRVSLSSLLANPLILPVQPAVMVLGGMAVLAGWVFQPVGQVVAYVAWPFVLYTIRMVELLSRLPWDGIVLGQVSIAWVLVFYAVLFGGTLAIVKSPPGLWGRLRGILRPSLVAFGLVILNVLVWRTALSAPDGRLHLTVLDVSTASLSGQAVLVQTPGGRSLLVGGGPSTSALSDALGRRLPPGSRRLDFLIVANPDEAQVAALPALLERAPPGQVLWAGPTHATGSARYLQAALSEADLRPISAQSGQALDLGKGAVLRVLSANPRGAVLLLEWGSFSALLPFGMDVEALEALHNDPEVGPVTALLLAESGYAPLNPPEWIERLNPQAALLSVAAGDREGRPDQEMLLALEGYTLLRTDKNGWIELTTDGQQMWMEVERR
jgi:competence protein ComEC